MSKAARGSQAGQDCDDRASGPRAAEHVTTTEGANFPTPYGEIYDRRPRSVGSWTRHGVRASTRKTGRVAVVDVAPATCSAASEIAGAVPVPEPYSPSLEAAMAPTPASIAQAVRDLLAE